MAVSLTDAAGILPPPEGAWEGGPTFAVSTMLDPRAFSSFFLSLPEAHARKALVGLRSEEEMWAKAFLGFLSPSPSRDFSCWALAGP